MGERPPIVVDTSCSLAIPPADEELRAWFKALCDDKGRCQPGVPRKLPDYLTAQAANNALLRRNCPEKRPQS